MYDIRDVLKKAIEIAEKKKIHYVNVLENTPDVRMRAILQILIRGIEKDVHYYEKMLEGLTENLVGHIDFNVYDLISSLMNQFARTLSTKPRIRDRKGLIQYALETEQASYALLIDIQGRLAQNEDITTSVSYYVLSEIIEEKSKTIKNLEMFAKQH